MNYSVVICSHNRIQTLKERTLALLQHYEIPSDKIFVFVAPEEMAAYQTALPGVQIRQGALGLKENRHAASLAFPSGCHLVWMDDDLKGLVVRGADNRLVGVSDLNAVFEEGFALCEAKVASLWGLYPVANAKWLKNSVSEGLIFCYGCCYGTLNSHTLLTQTNFKEDVERCLILFERGERAVRMNWVAPVQSYRKGTGGLNETRTYDAEVSECMRLQSRFPHLVTLRHKKDRVDLTFPRKFSRSSPRLASVPEL
jgi:hypothetical protein